MKIYEGRNAEGELVYFEISSIWTRWLACRVVSKIPGVEILEKPKRFWFVEDEVFCIFRLGSRVFEIWEPYGDNSRFHIGEAKVTHTEGLEIVKEAFRKSRRCPFISSFR